MDSPKSKFRIVFSSQIDTRFNSIWEWTADHFGVDQADSYDQFLRSEIRSLAIERERGIQVGNNPNRRYLVMKWSPSSYAHVAFYSVNYADGEIYIEDIFHSAMDWKPEE